MYIIFDAPSKKKKYILFDVHGIFWRVNIPASIPTTFDRFSAIMRAQKLKWNKIHTAPSQ
jgi:hypothetical protein